MWKVKIMEAVLTQLISQLNSSVFVLIALLFIVFYFTFQGAMRLGEWKEKFLHHSNRIEKTERIADTVIELKTKIDLIYQFNNPSIPTRAASPMALTPIGREIVEKIKADDIFKQYEAKLVGLVADKKPNNAYDIQKVAIDVAKYDMIKLLNEEQLLTVKNEAYMRGLLVEDIMGIFGIFLRNKILSDKNIPIADVDKHSPAQ